MPVVSAGNIVLSRGIIITVLLVRMRFLVDFMTREIAMTGREVGRIQTCSCHQLARSRNADVRAAAAKLFT